MLPGGGGGGGMPPGGAGGGIGRPPGRPGGGGRLPPPCLTPVACSYAAGSTKRAAGRQKSVSCA